MVGGLHFIQAFQECKCEPKKIQFFSKLYYSFLDENNNWIHVTIYVPTEFHVKRLPDTDEDWKSLANRGQHRIRRK